MSTYDPYLEPSEDNTPPQERPRAQFDPFAGGTNQPAPQPQWDQPQWQIGSTGDSTGAHLHYQPQPRGTNGLAIASFVLGIVWAFWIGSALAIIFGHTALGQIKAKGQEGKGLAIAGLVLGYVGAATFALFVALPLLLAALGA